MHVHGRRRGSCATDVVERSDRRTAARTAARHHEGAPARCTTFRHRLDVRDDRCVAAARPRHHRARRDELRSERRQRRRLQRQLQRPLRRRTRRARHLRRTRSGRRSRAVDDIAHERRRAARHRTPAFLLRRRDRPALRCRCRRPLSRKGGAAVLARARLRQSAIERRLRLVCSPSLSSTAAHHDGGEGRIPPGTLRSFAGGLGRRERHVRIRRHRARPAFRRRAVERDARRGPARYDEDRRRDDRRPALRACRTAERGGAPSGAHQDLVRRGDEPAGRCSARSLLRLGARACSGSLDPLDDDGRRLRVAVADAVLRERAREDRRGAREALAPRWTAVIATRRCCVSRDARPRGEADEHRARLLLCIDARHREARRAGSHRRADRALRQTMVGRRSEDDDRRRGDPFDPRDGARRRLLRRLEQRVPLAPVLASTERLPEERDHRHERAAVERARHDVSRLHRRPVRLRAPARDGARPSKRSPGELQRRDVPLSAAARATPLLRWLRCRVRTQRVRGDRRRTRDHREPVRGIGALSHEGDRSLSSRDGRAVHLRDRARQRGHRHSQALRHDGGARRSEALRG